MGSRSGEPEFAVTNGNGSEAILTDRVVND